MSDITTDEEFAVLPKEAEELSGHEILLAELGDPDEVKLILALAKEGKTNLLYEQVAPYQNSDEPVAVIVPWPFYMVLLRVQDPVRARRLEDELGVELVDYDTPLS